MGSQSRQVAADHWKLVTLTNSQGTLAVTWREKRFAPGGVRTPIALYYGSFIFEMMVEAAEIGRFWLNIP